MLMHFAVQRPTSDLVGTKSQAASLVNLTDRMPLPACRRQKKQQWQTSSFHKGRCMRIQQKFIRSIAISLGMTFLLSIMAVAVEPVPLPDIQLTAADGSTVKSNALPSQGNWLIIYIQPRNQFSDNLLRLLKRDQYPTLAQHAVIIVGGSIDDLKTAQTRFPELPRRPGTRIPTRAPLA